MSKLFEVVFLKDAVDFMKSLDRQTFKKIDYNIRQAQFHRDPKLFKKLTNEIWEFRTRHNGRQYRLFAFWDKRNAAETLVIATHGIVKKFARIRSGDLKKAITIRQAYFNSEL